MFMEQEHVWDTKILSVLQHWFFGKEKLLNLDNHEAPEMSCPSSLPH